jgi:hypothetical protein
MLEKKELSKNLVIAEAAESVKDKSAHQRVTPIGSLPSFFYRGRPK